MLQPASLSRTSAATASSFKPHQRGGGCCSILKGFFGPEAGGFQTPSAGRWVLQLSAKGILVGKRALSFKPHQRGGGCCSTLEIAAVL